MVGSEPLSRRRACQALQSRAWPGAPFPGSSPSLCLRGLPRATWKTPTVQGLGCYKGPSHGVTELRFGEDNNVPIVHFIRPLRYRDPCGQSGPSAGDALSLALCGFQRQDKMVQEAERRDHTGQPLGSSGKQVWGTGSWRACGSLASERSLATEVQRIVYLWGGGTDWVTGWGGGTVPGNLPEC